MFKRNTNFVLLLSLLFALSFGVTMADDFCQPPTLTFPGDANIMYGPTTPHYDWMEVNGAVYYEIEIYDVELDTTTYGDTTQFGDYFVRQLVDTNYYAGVLLDVIDYMDTYYWCRYYWRVRPLCDSVGWGDWSEFNTFIVYSKKPHLDYPANGEKFYNTDTVKMGWTCMPAMPSYTLQIDNNSDFGSLEINIGLDTCRYHSYQQLSNDKYYWRVKNNFFGIWSYTNYFTITSPPVPSCPVLYRYDGSAFIEENPLLTACENLNYAKVVTDYYQLSGPVSPQNDNVVFQLRELEDEITYLDDVQLITVDHPEDTRVGCTVDGEVFVYGESVEPLSAVDDNGNDCLALLRENDDKLYVSDRSGHLVLTFPQGYGSFVTFKGPIKLPCPGQQKANGIETEVFTVEILSENGEWVTMPDIPSRQNATQEYVLADLPAVHTFSELTVRISWEGGLSTDAISLDMPSDVTPITNNWSVTDFDLRGGGVAAKSWPGFGSGETLEMVKGDILEFSFAVDDDPAEGMTRDYIIRAVGRYQPDYGVYSHLMPGQFQLYNNRPNPFNPTTIISYDLPVTADVQLDIYNVLGQHVSTLVDKTQEAGHHEVVWESIDKTGKTVANGIYFYRIEAGDFSASKKMMLLK